MAKVEFQYDGISTIIQCQEDQKFDEICQNFIKKSLINETEIYYFYNGIGGAQFDKNLTFNQMANSIDKQRKKMNILVMSYQNLEENKSIIKSKYIICPECGESIKMKIKDYTINLFECKNNHKIDNIPINEFEKTQMINLKNIKCDICKEKNKFNTYNNEFYKCYDCNINICPLCKEKHNENHNIYNYDKFNYICGKHNENLTNYCKKCKLNICTLCEDEHLDHDMILLRNIMPKKDILSNKIKEIKKSKDIFDNNINKIIEILNKVKITIDNYYKFEERIIHNYEQKQRNYDILLNINEIINNNDILKDINSINNDINIINQFNNIFKIYNKINNCEMNYYKNNKIEINDNKENINKIKGNENEKVKNEIKLIVKIGKNDINKKIYFLDNTNGECYINGVPNQELHNHLKELNESNVELYIDDNKYKYQKYFIPEKEGEYNILLKFNIAIEDCSCMFFNCINLINIDLSLFNSKNVTNMGNMFWNCRRLTNLDLSSFSNNKVTNVYNMLACCGQLKEINLSSFNTKYITNMAFMFSFCYNLTNINLSSFDTRNVINMQYMFGDCRNLEHLDLSSFNIEKVNDIEHMFNNCSNLTNINLSSFNMKNVKRMDNMFKNCSNLKEIKINKISEEKIKKLIDESITKLVIFN